MIFPTHLKIKMGLIVLLTSEREIIDNIHLKVSGLGYGRLKIF